MEHRFAASFDGGFRAELARSLGAFDIVPQDEFRIPGTRTQLDFFLPQEPFGVVELKAGPHVPLGPVIEQLLGLREALGEEARLYLVHIQPSGKHDVKLDEFIDGVLVIRVRPDDASTAARLIASDFAPTVAPSTLQWTTAEFVTRSAADPNPLTKTLSQLSINLYSQFLSAGRDVLEQEIEHLRTEIAHEHFTAAALRVGRALEFVVYSACLAWSVPVREPFLAGLQSVRDRSREVESALIKLSGAMLTSSSANEERALRLAAEKLQRAITDVSTSLLQNASVPASAPSAPRNVQALLRDITRAYKSIPAVGAQTDAAGKSVKSVLELRNNAAHASPDGRPREVERAELERMLVQLNQVLFCLARCGHAIRARSPRP
jgi:hypothetical protein